MSRQFRCSPDVSRSASPLRRSAPVVVDLTTTLEGRTLVIGPEDSLICGPCKDNGINSHGARHLTRCEHLARGHGGEPSCEAGGAEFDSCPCRP
jgi:hypothetical protein